MDREEMLDPASLKHLKQSELCDRKLDVHTHDENLLAVDELLAEVGHF